MVRSVGSARGLRRRGARGGPGGAAGARLAAGGFGGESKGYRLVGCRATRRAARRLSPWLGAVLLLFACVGARADEPRIVCLGDSLTEGYGLEPEQAYPAVLERELRRRGLEARVVNAGISGSTSAGAVSRLRWQLRAEPDFLVLALGGNDGLRGIDVEATREHLGQAIELAKSRGVTVVLGGMKIPPNYGPEYTEAFESLFPALAERYGVALVPFLLEGVAADPALNLPDGIHPNARGAELVAQNVLEVLLPLLRARESQEKPRQ